MTTDSISHPFNMKFCSLGFWVLIFGHALQLVAQEDFFPDLRDRLNRLIYLVELPPGNQEKTREWESALDRIPDVNRKILECVERDYLHSENSQQLSLSIQALCYRSDLTPDQLQTITRRLAQFPSPKPDRNLMDLQFLTGGLNLLRHYPSSGNERLALSFINDENAGVFLCAVHTLSEIGGMESLAKVKEVVARREESSRGMLDPVLYRLKPYMERFESRMDEKKGPGRHTSSPENTKPPGASAKAPEKNRDSSAGAPPNPETVRRVQSSMRDRVGDGAFKAKDALESFLTLWKPIGRTSDELRSVLGTPDRDVNGSIFYIFDTGFGGTAFIFKVADGKIIAVERTGVE